MSSPLTFQASSNGTTSQTAPSDAALLTVGDVVKRSEHATFTNAVQLGWYPSDPRNLDLTRGYIFTQQSVGLTQSSLSIFERVRASFQSKFNPHHHVVIATYGHGKSHLALAIANYFGRENGAPEVENILEGLEHLNALKAKNFRDFKEAHKPFLILRLRGDQARSLTHQVVSGLEVALREYPETSEATLGFWFNEALTALDRLEETPSYVESANAYLRERQMDLASLRVRLQDRDPAVHEVCLEAFKAAMRIRPDFGATIELESLLKQTTREWCGEDKPFAGLLILFDEFAAFIKKYATSSAASVDSSLQNLLEGVENCEGKAAFVAFSQYEPELTARLAWNRRLESSIGSSDEERDSLIKELNRLKRDQHYQLYSAMELVLDAYLQQDEKSWEILTGNERVLDAIEEGYNIVLRLFPDRYSTAQGWGDEKVYEVLARGCFPLHPLTTAILCSTKLREVTDPRGVLGFVLSQLDTRQTQAATQDGVPNWVYATALVDWFGEMLTEDEDEWRQYQNAVRTSRADVPDAPAAHWPILRAMMLHSCAKLKVGRSEDDFARNIAALSGLTKTACLNTLKELAEGGYIRPSTDGIYTFWPLGEDGSKVEKRLRTEVETIFRDPHALREHLEGVVKAWNWQDVEVSYPAGSAIDWAAQNWLLPRPLFSAERISSIVQGYKLSSNKGVVEAKRGYVLRPIATTDDEIQSLRTGAAGLLDEALKSWGETPPPVILAIPTRSQSNFLNLLVRYGVLSQWKSDRNIVKEVGDQAFVESLKKAETDISKAWGELSESEEFVVPRDYRNAVEASRVAGQKQTVENVLNELYGLSYGKSVPSFFTQYRRDNSNLKDAVIIACRCLAKNSMVGYDLAAQNKGQVRELKSQFLDSGTRGHWSVVGVDGRVREPQNSRVREAWRVLDEAIPPGAEEVPVQSALLKLLNSPYGYDYNTLSLVFCAWFGANSHALKLSNSGGRTVSLEECLPVKTDPKTFINTLVYTQDVRLMRRDDEGWNLKVDALLKQEREQNGFSVEEAEAGIDLLQEYVEDENAAPTKARDAASARERLIADLKRAQDYGRFVEKSKIDIQGATTPEGALKVLFSISNAPSTGVVRLENVATLAEIRELAHQRLEQTVESRCQRQEKLSSIRDYSLQKQYLLALRKRLLEEGESDLDQRVQTALTNLDARERELNSEGRDAEFVARLKALRRETKLAELREGRRLIDDYEPHVAATQTLMEETDAALQSLIKETQDAVTAWEERLPTVVTPSETRRLSNDIQKRHERYENTPEFDRLDAILTRCEVLDKYFEKLADLKRERPHNSKEVDRIERKLAALQSDDWSTAQQALIDQTLKALQERVRQDREEAVAWLEEAERKGMTEEPIKLMAEIDKGHAFLPDEYETRRKALKRNVQKRIDDDELKRVESSFRKIKDRAKRNECLRVLQAILDE